MVPVRALLAIVVLAVVIAFGATPVWAHDGRLPVATTPAMPSEVVADVIPLESISATPSQDIAPFVALAALVAAATLLLVHAPRRLVAFVVVPLLVVVMFETGVHGVHHLGDPRAAEQCIVAVSADHVTGAIADVPADAAPLTLVSAPVALPDSPLYAGRQHRSGDSRAPPALSA